MSTPADATTPPLVRVLPDEAATIALGAALARALRPGLVVYLEGDLGAGKTTLARALIQALVPDARVKSPTYTLVETYPAATHEIQHLDLYRIADAQELEFLGLRDRDADAVMLVEWPARGAGVLPRADLVVALARAGDGRVATITSTSPPGAATLATLRA